MYVCMYVFISFVWFVNGLHFFSCMFFIQPRTYKFFFLLEHALHPSWDLEENFLLEHALRPSWDLEKFLLEHALCPSLDLEMIYILLWMMYESLKQFTSF